MTDDLLGSISIALHGDLRLGLKIARKRETWRPPKFQTVEQPGFEQFTLSGNPIPK